MESLGGLSAFFYNIIPGTLFLLLIDIFFSDGLLEKLVPDHTERIFWTVVVGLSLGLIGQGLFKHLLKNQMNISVFKEIKKNHSEVYKNAVKMLSINGISEEKIEDHFYAMDNFLRNNGRCYVINYYAERAALWININLGLILLIPFILNKLLYSTWPNQQAL